MQLIKELDSNYCSRHLYQKERNGKNNNNSNNTYFLVVYLHLKDLKDILFGEIGKNGTNHG